MDDVQGFRPHASAPMLYPIQQCLEKLGWNARRSPWANLLAKTFKAEVSMFTKKDHPSLQDLFQLPPASRGILLAISDAIARILAMGQGEAARTAEFQLAMSHWKALAEEETGEGKEEEEV